MRFERDLQWSLARDDEPWSGPVRQKVRHLSLFSLQNKTKRTLKKDSLHLRSFKL